MNRARLFPAIIFALLGVNATIVGLTLYLANSDRSFAVEPGYYQKAMSWDQDARRREASRTLGWNASVQPGVIGAAERHIALRLTDKGGRAIAGARVRLVAFANARAGDRFAEELSESEPGIYTAALPAGPAGLWEFRITATRGDDSFSQIVRTELAGTAP